MRKGFEASVNRRLTQVTTLENECGVGVASPE